MSRSDKIINDYQQHLKDKDIKNIPEFVQSILNVDITKGKYSRFLLDCYLNDKFRKEDLIGGLESTIGQAISLFHKHKSKLPEDKRSIYQYDSPGNLWNAVKQFDGELSGKEIKRSEQEKIYTETEFVYKDEESGLKIITPLTIESAKWWGKGTRWCTSADKNNMFFTYAKQAPLLIFLMPDGNKLQLWKNGNSNIQFMDEADNQVALDYIEQNWNVLEPIVMWLKDFRFIPEQYKSKEVYEIFLKGYEQNFESVPKKYITEEFCKFAVQQNGLILQYFPKKINFIKSIKINNLCELAVCQNGNALEFVPKRMVTEKICKLAVQQNGEALKYIPEEFKTEEMCKIAVQSNGYALRLVPEHMRIEELCRASIKQNGNFLQFVPYKMITEELCKLAVENGGDLYSVPKEYITEGLCRIAINSDQNILKYFYQKNDVINNFLKKEKKHSVEITDKFYSISLQKKYNNVFQEIQRCYTKNYF